MVSPRAAVALALGIATVLFAAPVLAKRKPLVNCPTGQFVVAGAPLAVGDGAARREWPAILVSDGMVSIPGVCPPTPAKLRPGRRGMRISAQWTNCDGVEGKVRLRGITSASCSELSVRLTMPRTVKNKPKGGFKMKAIVDSCFVDAGVQLLENGQELYAAEQCTSDTDDVLEVLDTICNLLQGAPCLSTSATCGRRAQEIFTGVSLFPSVSQPPQWNHFGGRGELMAQAGLCILKDLANGPHTNAAGVSIGIGDVSITQKVGFRAFNLGQRMVGLYHDIDFCVPVFGCLTGLGQKIVVRLASSCPAHPVGRSCGTYPVEAAHALDVLVGESSRYLGVAAPVITVITPYGPVNVQPQIQFWSKLGTVLSPFATSAFKDRTPGPLDYRIVDQLTEPFIDFYDWYGRIPGVLFSSEAWSAAANVGWDSQIGFGSRDARPWTSAWSPASDPMPVRPDHDLGTARADGEKQASVHVRAEAEISYSPTELLPSWLKGSAVDLWFKIWIKPKADAAVAGQLGIYASEGFRYQLDSDLDHYTQLVVRDGASAAGSFVVDAGMDLVASIDLPSPFDDITLVDVHPDLSIPVTKGDDDSRVGGKWREARAGSQSVPSGAPAFDGPVQTFHGDVDGAAFIAQCLAEPVPEQPDEPPSFTPGDPDALNRDILFPCDICVGVGQHDIEMCVPTPGHGSADCTQGPRCHPALIEAGICEDLSYHSTPQTAMLYPATSNPLPANKHWECDGYHKSGCLDLCTFDPLTGALTVAKSAVDLVGPKCGIPVPR